MKLRALFLLTTLGGFMCLPVSAQPVATVNGKEIPAYLLEEMPKRGMGPGKDAESLALAREDLIMRAIATQEADRLGLTQQPKVAAQIEFARSYILMHAIVADHASKNPVSEADLKAAHQKFVAEIANAKEYQISDLLAGTEEEATRLIAKFKAGERFENLVPPNFANGTRGGDRGWIAETKFDPAFAGAIARLKPGQITEPALRTPDGFVIVKVGGARPLQPPTFEEFRSHLLDELKDKQRVAYLKALREKAVVK